MKNCFFYRFYLILPIALLATLFLSSYSNLELNTLNNYPPSLAVQPLQYGLYKNEKFSFERIYPDNLIEEAQSLNENGISFSSNDGKVGLLIYGSLNASISNFQELFLLGQENLTVTNKKFNTNYFYITGNMEVNGVTFIRYTQKQVVYTTDTNGNAIQYLITVQITYPESEKELYDPYCTLLQTKYLN